MTDLLDGNVLVALTFSAHVHHERAHAWRRAHLTERFATCPITQGTLLRMAMRAGATASVARDLITGLYGEETHEFWSDDLGYDAVTLTGVLGHRQITDAYLAELARARGSRLITLDSGLAALHPDVAMLVPAV